MISEDDVLESELIGIRAAAFCVRRWKLFVALTSISAGLGFAGATLLNRAYKSSAAVEIGMRPPNEALEMPLIARERLLGILEKNRRVFPGALDFTLVNRRDPKTRALTRTIDVTALARTSSTARAILEASLDEFLLVHREMHAFEARLVAQEHGFYRKAAGRVDEALRSPDIADLTTAVVREDKSGEKIVRTPLTAALLGIGRRMEATSAQLLARRAPPTRVVEPASAPELRRSRSLLFAVTGGLLGAMIAFGIGALAELDPRRRR